MMLWHYEYGYLAAGESFIDAQVKAVLAMSWGDKNEKVFTIVSVALYGWHFTNIETEFNIKIYNFSFLFKVVKGTFLCLSN